MNNVRRFPDPDAPSFDDPLLRELRSLRLGEPDDALRGATLEAARAVLEARPWWRGLATAWRGWMLETALAGAVAACVAMLPVLRAEIPDTRLDGPPSTSTFTVAELGELAPYAERLVSSGSASRHLTWNEISRSPDHDPIQSYDR